MPPPGDGTAELTRPGRPALPPPPAARWAHRQEAKAKAKVAPRGARRPQVPPRSCTRPNGGDLELSFLVRVVATGSRSAMAAPRWEVVVLGLASVAWCAGDAQGGDAQFPWDEVRLPRSVVPLHYHLLIHPNLTTLTFTGTVDIDVAVAQPTKAVVLHGKRLRVTRAAIEAGAGSTCTVRDVRLLRHPPREQLALLATEPLCAGHNYTLRIQYSANLSDSFHGFYKSTYRTQEGELRYLLVVCCCCFSF